MRRSLFWLGVSTVLVFGLLGILLIFFFQETTIWEVFTGGKSLLVQLIWGGTVGIASSMMALFVISAPFFARERHFYQNLIRAFDWTPLSILLVSACAGLGEEVFFRAGLQPLLGIGWTSLLFVALHGYLNPWNWRISVYGSLMVVVIYGFGYLFEEVGLWAAVMAHAVFDLVVISQLVYRRSSFV
jgi:membrane protease YdiL (CAAX protease family)